MCLKIEVVLSSKSSSFQACILHHPSWTFGSTIGSPYRDRPDALRLTLGERTGVKVNHLVIPSETKKFMDGSHYGKPNCSSSKQKFPKFYGILSYTTMFITARHSSLPAAKLIWLTCPSSSFCITLRYVTLSLLLNPDYHDDSLYDVLVNKHNVGSRRQNPHPLCPPQLQKTLKLSLKKGPKLKTFLLFRALLPHYTNMN
jgi:hypothetical protein